MCTVHMHESHGSLHKWFSEFHLKQLNSKNINIWQKERQLEIEMVPHSFVGVNEVELKS